MEPPPKARKRRRWAWIGAVAILLVSLHVLTTLNYYYGWYPFTERGRRLRAARDAYESSRKVKGLRPGTTEFACFGITAGMSESEVEALLPEPTILGRHFTDIEPPWDGFLNIYEFQHGPLDTIRGPGNERPFSKETLWVFFDTQGRAARIFLFQWGDVHTFGRDSYDVDLPMASSGWQGEE